MKATRLLLVALIGTAFMATAAFANPGLLGTHPGYPMGDTKSPVDGTRTSYDSGQPSAGGDSASMKAAGTADAAALNNVSDPNRMRITSGNGAGRLPDVDGPLNRVNPNPAGAKSTVIR